MKVKICGLTRREDAMAAVEAGADYLGTVLVAGSPRHLEPEEAREVTADLEAEPVAVVANLGVEGTVKAAQASGARVVQLHGDETPDQVRRIAEAGPWRVWKALRIQDPVAARQDVLDHATEADGILLDGWHPERLGGSGVVFPWEEGAALMETLRGRVERVVAGGLDPENVARAVRVLRPEVVDVSSGVESSPGVKDHRLVRTFIRNARDAARAP